MSSWRMAGLKVTLTVGADGSARIVSVSCLWPAEYRITDVNKSKMCYVNYSNIAARVLRQSVKGAKKEDPKESGSFMRFFFWANGEVLAEGTKPSQTDAKEKAG